MAERSFQRAMRLPVPAQVYEAIPIRSSARETRVLQLEPSGGDYDAPVRCSLVKVELGDTSEYEALSYCWGQQTDLRVIYVNDHEVEVTQNLESALRHLRRKNQRRLLWIDALSINQQDVSERSSQVAMMHEIYQRATRTVSWLGEGGEDGELALDFLQWYAGRKALYDPGTVDGQHKDYEAQGWAAVAKLMQRPYWRRLWVMQEISLSKTQPRVVCGRRRLQWGMFMSAFENEEWAYFPRSLHRVRGATRQLIRQGISDRPSRSGRHIIFLLSHSAGFETTEPRDRVYALYGLLRVAGIVRFKPDYSKPIAEVYQQITEYVLSMKGGLDVLELKPQGQDESLPSWVLDLSRVPPPSLPAPKKSSWQRPSEEGSESTANLTVDSGALRISGAVVDELASFCSVPPCLATALRRAAEDPDSRIQGSGSLRSNSNTAVAYWQSLEREGPQHGLCRRAIEYLSTFQSVVNALCKSEEDVLNWVPRAFDWQQMTREAPLCGKDVGVGFDGRYWSHLTPVMGTLSLKLLGRACFVTRHGWIGVGMSGAGPGDVLVAFQSTKHLHMLRRDGEYSQHRGAAVMLSSSSDSASKQRGIAQVFANIRERKIGEEVFMIR